MTVEFFTRRFVCNASGHKDCIDNCVRSKPQVTFMSGYCTSIQADIITLPAEYPLPYQKVYLLGSIKISNHKVYWDKHGNFVWIDNLSDLAKVLEDSDAVLALAAGQEAFILYKP